MKSIVSINSSTFQVVDDGVTTIYNKLQVSDVIKNQYSVIIVFENTSTEEFTLLETETYAGSRIPFASIDLLYDYITEAVYIATEVLSDITVRPDGSGRYTTIEDALAYAATIASSTNPQTVNLVGAFTENPLVIPEYTKVNLVAGSISPINNSQPLITLGGVYSEFRGGNIVGPSSSDAFYVTAGNTAIKDVVVSGAGLCGIRVQDVSFPNRCLIRNATLASCSKGFCVDNSFVILTTASSSLASVASIEVNNNSNMVIDSFISVSSTLALSVLDSSTVRMNASQMSIDDVSVADWNSVYLSFTSDKENDEAAIIAQELQVGVPEKGQELSTGEGESYTRGMLVYSETPGGVFTDKSALAASASSSLFGFDGNLTNNSIYIASSLSNGIDTLRHYGIKASVNTAAVYGTGDIVLEYWNGTSWTAVSGNERDADPPYYSLGNDYFKTLGSTHIRYNIKLSINDWSKNDPMSIGTSYYWMRFRISSDLTTAPIFEQFKLHPNKVEFNSDSFREFFGSGRSIGQLPINIGQGKPIAGNMQNQSLWIDNNVGVGFLTNKFTATTDIIGWNFLLPFDADSSSPITFIWGGLANQAAPIQWTVRLSHIEAGVHTLYTSNPPAASNPFTKTVVINPGSTVLNVANTYSVELDISDAIERRAAKPGDLIFITLQPTVLSGTFSLVGAGANYIKWTDGGHI